jgi:polyribonucleotide nucleotidyltransferase
MKIEREIGGKPIIIETGGIALQSDGSCTVRYGDTMILATACMSKVETPFAGFAPLLCDYRERTYAAGKIPGGFFKREGRPRDKEILTARLMDRPIRPLIPTHFVHEIQLVVTVLSQDEENDADIPSVLGASLALALSPIPFNGPIGAVRIGKVGDEFIVNPGFSELEESELNLVVAGTKSGITMIEAGAREAKEDTILKALNIAEQEIRKIAKIEEDIARSEGKKKFEVIVPDLGELEGKVKEIAASSIKMALEIPEKKKRSKELFYTLEKVREQLGDEENGYAELIFDNIEREFIRKQVLESRKRLDKRSLDDIRPIQCEVGILPRTHGSAIFTRGETRSLCATTLGTVADEQKIEALKGESFKSFMVHYNFPPFSVGEVKFIRGPGRREIGHGSLAERALEPIIPKDEDFPYTIRIVSDILSSNGSSSMATVCGGSLSLMDAGVPLKCHVAGISMGLIGDTILTDILGEEDHYGDMDFKVAGTREGITAIQLDIKTEGIHLDIVKQALERAKNARLSILKTMEETIEAPRSEVSNYAPKLRLLFIPREKIGRVIGSGGRTIREIQEKTGAELELSNDGRMSISAPTKDGVNNAVKMVESLIEEVEVGKTYIGKVKRIMPYGAFVEILPGKDGMIHISQIAHHRVKSVEDELKIGDEVSCRVIGIDEQGRVQLSRKALLHEKVGSK